MKFRLFILALALSPAIRAQGTYTWIAASSTKWTTLADWSPTISTTSNSYDYPLGPGAQDTITNGTNTETLQVDNPGTTSAGGTVTNPTAVAELDTGSASKWNIENGTSLGTGSAVLSVGTLRVGLNGATTLALIDNTGNTSGYTLSVDVTGNAYLTQAAIINVGNASGTSGQELAGFGITGTLYIGGASTANFNVLSDYSIGVVDSTDSTANKITLLNNNDTNRATGATRNALVGGLEGGTVTISGAGGTYGGNATLVLDGSGANNYASAATLIDGSPTGNTLTLTADLTGGATQTLTGANTYSGGTTVSAGTLYVSNITAPVGSGLGVGSVTVAGGATLGGTGTIAPNASDNVTINGVLEPGDLGQTAGGAFTPGPLIFNFTAGSQLVFGSGSALDLTLGGVSSSVSFTTAGTWLSGTGNWTLNLANGGGVQVGTAYPVFANDTDSPASFAPAAVTYTTGGTLYNLTSTAYELQTVGSNYTITLPGPVITSSPPASTSLVVGGSASFAVVASGTGTVTYQWELNGTALANGTQGDGSGVSGATTATLNLTNLQLTDAGRYTCAITDVVGTVTSPAATLVTAPTIGTEPASTSATSGGSASFSVTASGAGTLGYQWYLNGTALADGSGISGSATATLSLTNVQGASQGSYTVVVTDASGSTTSTAATLYVQGTEAITTQPQSVVAASGQGTAFSVVATGTGTLSYQWYFNGAALANGTLADGTAVFGVTNATLSLTDLHAADAGSYKVVITDSTGSDTSVVVMLSGMGTASFQIQPVGVTLAAGQTASFYALATGTGTVSYQWYLNGATAVASATDVYLLVTPVSSTNAGTYTCIATDSTGSTVSSEAALTLNPSADLGRLTNVSVRTNCGTGAANIIAGFVLGGAGNDGSSKSMLIRADGPELANFGVPGFLPDPSLDVFNTAGSSPVSVGQNTGWCVTQTNENQVIAADSAVYAFPLTTNSASSATVLALPPAQYTENVTGVSGDTGIALAEVYDVTNATETYSPSLPRLINVSARANVATGAGNLIAGFTIGGSTDKTVLVRGTGPGLSEFGLTGLLDQPTLAVYSTSSGDTLVGTNTGWAEDSVLAAAAASVYAFTQTSSADCALLVTLPPGTYTANLNSNDGTSGLALVEVYEVP